MCSRLTRLGCGCVALNGSLDIQMLKMHFAHILLIIRGRLHWVFIRQRIVTYFWADFQPCQHIGLHAQGVKIVCQLSMTPQDHNLILVGIASDDAITDIAKAHNHILCSPRISHLIAVIQASDPENAVYVKSHKIPPFPFCYLANLTILDYPRTTLPSFPGIPLMIRDAPIQDSPICLHPWHISNHVPACYYENPPSRTS